MLTFPPFDPDAERVLTFDCSPDLDPNEVLQGGAILKDVQCTAGIDPNPMGIVLDSPSYDPTGRMILLPVGNADQLNGNDYVFVVESATTESNKIIVVRALLQIRAE